MRDWEFRPAADLGLPLRKQFASLRRESGLVSASLHFFWWLVVRSYMRRFHGLSVVGSEHLPTEPPFVLVANHASHLDALALAAMLPAKLCQRTFPLAAGDTFFKDAFIASFAAVAMNALPVWRKKPRPQDLEALRQRLLTERLIFILFPEGTRSRTGDIAPFKSGLGRLVAATPVPVVPCFLRGTFAAMPPGAWRPRRGRIAVHVGRPLPSDAISHDRLGWMQIAANAEAAVRSLAAADG
jgi:1-acyl-sn-glycerol-3-phosphate acyltransferase